MLKGSYPQMDSLTFYYRTPPYAQDPLETYKGWENGDFHYNDKTIVQMSKKRVRVYRL